MQAVWQPVLSCSTAKGRLLNAASPSTMCEGRWTAIAVTVRAAAAVIRCSSSR